MTHSHALDFTLVETALARSDWRYVGMIGSAAKRAQLERRLAARGIARERLAAVVCPIGAPLPGLTGKAPGTIAVAVAAELMAAKAGRVRGGALARRTGALTPRWPAPPRPRPCRLPSPPPRRRCCRCAASRRRIRPSSRTTASTSTSRAGEIHAVLGENGAGKSTLMKIIYGVVEPDAGDDPLGRRAGRRSTARRSARRLGIGMVFQHFSLFETLTVAENIALALPATAARRGARRAHPRGVGALRAAARSAPARARDVGRRAPARRDRALPAAGPAPPDHGRADVGADAAGGRRAVRHAAA